jgi:predicted  nucleic acid-binding Zn-ribbon protein
MVTKNQATKLKNEAGTLRRRLQMKMRRYSPFDDRYLRLEQVLTKAEERWQRRRAAEKAASDGYL